MAKEQLYSITTSGIQSNMGEHVNHLKALITGRRLLTRGRSFSPARYIRKLRIEFLLELSNTRKACFAPGKTFDTTRVGYTSTRALPDILALINSGTFPRLEHLTIHVERARYLLDETSHCPHWYVVAPLRRLLQLNSLLEIQITSQETKFLADLRRANRRIAQIAVHQFPADHLAVNIQRRDRVLEALREDMSKGLRIARIVEIMSSLFTNALVNEARAIPRHRCKCGCSIAKENRPYCMGRYICEPMRTDGPEEFAGLHVYEDMLPTLKRLSPFPHEHYVHRTSERLEREAANKKGHNLRPRKDVSYVF